MIKFRFIKDIEEAHHLWDIFTSNITIYDDWDFRYCFYKYVNFELFFYVAYDDENPVGLLPLQNNIDIKNLEFFGGTYMEDNQAFCKPGYEYIIPQLYKQIDIPAKLEYIDGKDPFTTKLLIQDYKYVLPLESIKNFEDYLQKYFDSETRGKFRRKIKNIQKEKIYVEKNKLEDIEILFDLNIKRFGEKSAFSFPYTKDRFRDLLKMHWPTFLFSFHINGRLEGVSFAIEYKSTYEYFNFGVIVDCHKDLRTYMHMKNIQTAIENKAKMFDAFSGDLGWKELWHFQKIPQYKFTYPEDAPLLGSV